MSSSAGGRGSGGPPPASARVVFAFSSRAPAAAPAGLAAVALAASSVWVDSRPLGATLASEHDVPVREVEREYTSPGGACVAGDHARGPASRLVPVAAAAAMGECISLCAAAAAAPVVARPPTTSCGVDGCAWHGLHAPVAARVRYRHAGIVILAALSWCSLPRLRRDAAARALQAAFASATLRRLLPGGLPRERARVLAAMAAAPVAAAARALASRLRRPQPLGAWQSPADLRVRRRTYYGRCEVRGSGGGGTCAQS